MVGMSSTYRILCVSHDPAIDATDEDYRSSGDAVDAMNATGGHVRADHPHCDLIVGRWSGGLIGVLGLTGYATEWLPADFLRLASLADQRRDVPEFETLKEVLGRIDRVGTLKQIRRLDPYLRG